MPINLMAITEGLVFALAAMFGWGVSDFIILGALDRLGKTKTLLIGYAAGFALLATGFLIFGGKFIYDANAVLYSFIVGFLHLAGLYMFYKGLQKGKMSLVSPIANSWPLIAILVGFVVFSQIPAANHLYGALLIMAGVALASARIGKAKKGYKINLMKGVTEAFFAMGAWGLSLSLIKIPVDGVGWPSAVILVTFWQLIFIGGLFLLGKHKKTNTDNKAVAIAFLSGILLVIGDVAYNVSVTSENLSLVSPITSAAPVVTVVLAFLIRKERLQLAGYAGIISVMAGILTMAL